MIIDNYYEKLETLHINCCKPRSYYIPTGDEVGFDFIDARRVSDRFLSLNGQWQFAFYESVADVPEDVISSDSKLCDFINVPSTWQSNGYDTRQYVNMDYAIPFDPPFVPKQNICGVYKRKFTINDTVSKKNYLNFEGVDSCFYVYINGSFVGYSEVSHSNTEFDITKFVSVGENDITVLVLKWCKGSYFETQDKFRESGIFRSVYILTRPERHLRDFKVTTILSKGHDIASVNIEGEFEDRVEIPIFFNLKAKDGKIVAEGSLKNGSTSFEIINPLLWSAEVPNLYILHLKSEYECISIYVGIRHICVEESVIKLNGLPILIHGVNRHDSHPIKGAAVDYTDILEDLKIMKQNNINAIRTSHYPNISYFPTLCDYYGFYLMSESDLEIHGVRRIYPDENQFCLLNNDQKYEHIFIDRQILNYERDKNHPSILFWSVGNESGIGSNIEAAAKYLKETDPSRLIHYESLFCQEDYKPDTSNLDMRSVMYPSEKDILDYLAWQHSLPMSERKPMMLCEYSHCMGNGPGDFEDYYKLFLDNPELVGGFVWEWCDHAVYNGIANNGKLQYLYGGDFGERLHDRNYCVDGLVYPNREESNSLRELKNVFRPVRMKYWDGHFEITNIYDFTNLKDILYIEYEIKSDGKTIFSEKVTDIDVPAHETRELVVKVPDELIGETYIIFNFRNLNNSFFVNKGYSLGFEQFCLNSVKPKYDFLVEGSVSAEENDKYIKLSGDGFHYIFNKNSGVFDSLMFNGAELLIKPMEFNVWRAPTDNDITIKKDWFRARYDDTFTSTYSVECEQAEEGLTINCHMAVFASGIQKIVDMKAAWIVNGKGEVKISCEAKKNTALPELPRFGIRIFLPKDFESVKYFGKGPYEAYLDKQQATYYDLFSSNVSDMHEDYIRPQENGNHIGTRFVTLCDGNEGFSIFAVDEPFNFGVSHYSQENLQHSNHSFELEPEPYTIICVDYAQNGIGSQSCGPKMKSKYSFTDEKFQFTFVISPKSKNLFIKKA